MSEYQYVAFRAIEQPVSRANLAYMRRQSSRAEIDEWSFENEYHFGDFRGDVFGMLERGYDIHLHFANFGIRRLVIRFPDGLPNWKQAEPYFIGEGFTFRKDKKGPGGCLVLEPYHESGDLPYLMDIDDLFDRLVPLRAEILDGDLRPLYIAHLAVAFDQDHDPAEQIEPPVLAGIGKATAAQKALIELYALGTAMLSAAATQSPPTNNTVRSPQRYDTWLEQQAAEAKNAWLAALMSDADSATKVRGELLAKYRDETNMPTWPVSPSTRTLAELDALAADIAEEAKRNQKAKTKRKHEKRLDKMAADPDAVFEEAAQLVAHRRTTSYDQAAQLLADLRDALEASGRDHLVRERAEKMRAENPTLHRLTKCLREQELLPKK